MLEDDVNVLSCMQDALYNDTVVYGRIEDRIATCPKAAKVVSHLIPRPTHVRLKREQFKPACEPIQEAIRCCRAIARYKGPDVNQINLSLGPL